MYFTQTTIIDYIININLRLSVRCMTRREGVKVLTIRRKISSIGLFNDAAAPLIKVMLPLLTLKEEIELDPLLVVNAQPLLYLIQHAAV